MEEPIINNILILFLGVLQKKNAFNVPQHFSVPIYYTSTHM